MPQVVDLFEQMDMVREDIETNNNLALPSIQDLVEANTQAFTGSDGITLGSTTPWMSSSRWPWRPPPKGLACYSRPCRPASCRRLGIVERVKPQLQYQPGTPVQSAQHAPQQPLR